MNPNKFIKADKSAVWKSILHDIANPLTLVQLNLDLIEQTAAGNQDLLDLVETSSISIGQIRELIKSAMLEVDGKVCLFSVVHELNTIYKMLQYKLQRDGILIELNFKEDLSLFGDVGNFHRAVLNLIINAIESLNLKPTGTNKYLYLGTSNRSGRFIIRVSDNGPGIPDTARDAVFRNGYSLKNNGTGIGLFTSKKIISEGFNGDIYFKSNSKQTDFYIDIPSKTLSD